MRRECRERLPCPRGLVIPTCITARASCTYRDACRDSWPAVPFEVGGGEDVYRIPGACENHKFTYLERGPWIHIINLACINNEYSYFFHLGAQILPSDMKVLGFLF